MTVEICATNILSVKNAALSGADRVELCGELSVGGTTPSLGMIEEAVGCSSLPVHCLIRPRSGHFNYSSEEVSVMRKDIVSAKETGCEGVVIGALTSDFELPLELLASFVALARPMEVSFHRAFDVVKKPLKAITQLIDLDFDRVLTSGQKESAVAGLELLKKLKKVSNGRITIMPGGGINPHNCTLFKEAGFEAVHFSAFKTFPAIASPKHQEEVFSFLQQAVGTSDVETIKKMVALLKA